MKNAGQSFFIARPPDRTIPPTFNGMIVGNTPVRKLFFSHNWLHAHFFKEMADPEHHIDPAKVIGQLADQEDHQGARDGKEHANKP